MRVKHNKQIKEKRAKLKKIKTQLTTGKIKKHSVRKSESMFAYKDIAVNLLNNMDIDNAQNISSDSMVDAIRWNSSEEQIDKETDNDWKLDNSEEETEEDTDDWTRIAPKEKRNIESPLVIEMRSDDAVSLDLPQIFKQEQKMNLNKKTFYNDIFEIDAPSNEEACVIVAKSINLKHNTGVQTQTSSVPSNTGENNENKDKLENISINNTSSPKRNLACKKLVKNRKSVDCNTEELRKSSDLKNRTRQSSRNRRKAPEFYCIRNIVIVIMKSESRFCFTGKLLVKVLYGAVQIYGYILNKSTDTTEVYSPRGYSNIAVETSKVYPKDGNIDDIWTALAAEGITRDSESKLQADLDNVRPGDAVLVLQDFENNLTIFLKTYFPYFRLFPDVNNSCYYPWTDPKRAEIILQADLHLEQYDSIFCKRLVTHPCITTDIAQKMLSRWRANEWSCTLIAGGKSVGKSTSARYLINSLLNTCARVVLVDVDPGQAECTPPGCISYSLIEEPLMGPNFTHLRTPVYQLFIDDVNVAQCVTRYLEGVKMLIERLREDPELSRLPIVVNTMGFTKNLGWEIAIFTIKLIRPTIITQIMSSKKKNNYDNVLSAEVVNKQECSWTFCDEGFIDWDRQCEHDLCVIQSQAEGKQSVTQTIMDQGPNQWNMEPYQQRELAMMSYLSDIVRDNNDSLHYKTGLSHSINQAAPYTAPFSSLCIIPQRLFGVPASRALSVVNGNIVALCGIDLTEESSQESTAISTLRVLTQRSPLCTCYGFGIVRGVDMERQQVYINTPLPMSIMQHVNCLAGCIRVPPMLLQLHPGAPYVSGSATLPTSREPRRGYFRMRYQKKQTPNKS